MKKNTPTPRTTLHPAALAMALAAAVASVFWLAWMLAERVNQWQALVGTCLIVGIFFCVLRIGAREPGPDATRKTAPTRRSTGTELLEANPPP